MHKMVKFHYFLFCLRKSNLLRFICFSGIVSWGIGCKNPIPAVYANVALARDWIDGQIRFLGLDTTYYTYRN